MRVDDHDIAAAIRTPEIDTAAAIVARYPRVREALIARQRALGEGGGVVMEGRDIGTVVFPAADVKVYLDASPEERARRRATDPSHTAGRGVTAIQDVATALEERDRSDRTRAASPLTQAPRRRRDRHDDAVDRGCCGAGDGGRGEEGQFPVPTGLATGNWLLTS